MYPDHHHPRSDVQAEHGPSSSDAQAEVLVGLTLDGLSALAGPSRAVVYEPDGRHSVVDLADLDPRGWVS